MIRSLFGRYALILATLVALVQNVPLQAMDAQETGSVHSHWISKSLVAVAAPLAAYGLIYRKHTNALHEIERRLDMSTLSATSKDHNFLCASWRSSQDNTPDGKAWEYPCDLTVEAPVVAQAFHNDAKYHADRVFIYDALGTRCQASDINVQNIGGAIAAEKQWFEQHMAYVAQYTNVPALIIEKYAANDKRRLEQHELTFGIALQLKDVARQDLIEFVEQTQAKVQAASRFKSVLHCGGWLPTSWSLAPCYHDASRVYLKLFLMYARLCALDAVWVTPHVQPMDLAPHN